MVKRKMAAWVQQDFENNSSESAFAKEELKEQCRQLWAKLKQLQGDVEVLQQKQPVRDNAVNSTPVNDTVHQEEKVRQLQAQISLLEDSKYPVLPDNPHILIEILKRDLTSEVEQLNDTLELIRSQRSDLEDQTSRVTEVRKQLMMLKTSLAEKVQLASAAETLTSAQFLAELEQKKAKLKLVYTARLQEMTDFLQQHYPLPSHNQVKKWNEDRENGSKKSDVKLLSMFAITEQLMNRCLDCPEDPYVTLDDTFWPPYIELLLRCGMASRHPAVSHRITLTPYHL